MIKKIVQYRFILDLGFKDSELVLAVGTGVGHLIQTVHAVGDETAAAP